MKVTIIGGGGRVGICAGFALQCGGVVSEIQLLDANEALAEGEALDLIHGAAYCPTDQRIYAAGYDRAGDTDIFIITAGLRRKPDESRLDLINRNVSLFVQILESVASCGMKPSAQVFVVSNPVDILTRMAVERLDLPSHQVYGLGTMLDSSRFSSLVADELGLPATQVRALMLGEHGDTMVPIWSSATVDGLPLSGFPGFNHGVQNRIAERARGSGAEVIKKKGGAGWAVGVSIREVIHAVALDQRRVLPISTQQTGCYGLREVCLSVPTIVGRQGVLETREIELWPKEKTGIQRSGSALNDTYQQVARP